MRTGSFGNRNADEMIKTLLEPKRGAISSIRSKLLAMNLAEDVEFDSINIEPVLIYSSQDTRRVFVKHKWETVALVRLVTEKEADEFLAENQDPKRSVERNELDGTMWAKFPLPQGEDEALKVLARIIGRD
ncbi:MAG TPA: hypothetical protein VFF30_02580 [Nitrososphaerales archaeon]|nr:hypothetical protein [Nitrososphaerales archaeon]